MGPRTRHLKPRARHGSPTPWIEPSSRNFASRPLGEGAVNLPRFVETLKKVGYVGPLVIEREVGDQQQRLRDCAHGIDVLRAILDQ